MLASSRVDNLQSKADLWCPPGQKISKIKFASYGMPQGTCRGFQEGSCHAHKSYDAFERIENEFEPVEYEIGALVKLIRNRQLQWLWDLILEFHGSCASKRMHLIQLFIVQVTDKHLQWFLL